MIFIGEKLNSSIPRTKAMMDRNDRDGILDLIDRQAKAGANYLDLNAAMMGEAEREWLIKLAEWTIQHSDAGIMLDSPSPEALIEAAKAVKDRPLILNSVTLAERIDALLPVAAEHKAGLVALPMASRMPETAGERVAIAGELIGKIKAAGLNGGLIYIDALVEALSAGDANPVRTLQTIRGIRDMHPDVHIIAGLSNISFGLPGRGRLNAAFAAMAICSGLDSVICDVLDGELMCSIYAAEALSGADEYSMNYIRHMRSLK